VDKASAMKELAEDGMIKVPPLNDPAVYAPNWTTACIVKREAIIGRVFAVYSPPQSRRVVR
jgi:hypothetical protein